MPGGAGTRQRAAPGSGLHRCDAGPLVLHTVAGFADGEVAAAESGVDLHTPGEFTPILAEAYLFHDFVLHRPSDPVADTVLAHEVERRNVVLDLGQQLSRQRQLTGLEDGAVDQAALPIAPSAALKAATSRASADRTNVTSPRLSRHYASLPYRS